MPPAGRVVFGRMEEAVFGRQAAQAVAEVARRVFLTVGGTLNRTTAEIDEIRRTLGNRCAGTFEQMPPHTPRRAVIEAAAAVL
jgi:maleylacetate reductase